MSIDRDDQPPETEQPGRRRGGARNPLGVAVAVAVLAFAAATLIQIFADPRPSDIVRPSVFSRSAIGHHAWYEVLDTLGRDVMTIRRGGTALAAETGLYVLAEPQSHLSFSIAHNWATAAPARMIVLPKWRGPRHPSRRGWIRRLIKATPEDDLLNAILPDASLVTGSDEPDWESAKALPPPTLPSPQLMLGPFDEVLMAEPGAGVLAGIVETPNGPTLILSDPDLIANHGLRRGDNAALAVAMMDVVSGGRGVIAFDETIHGLGEPLSLGRTLLSFPYVLATLAGLLALAAAVWAAAIRFGGIPHSGAAAMGGRQVLVRNAARLTVRGGHAAAAFAQYGRLTLRRARLALRAPDHLKDQALDNWLDHRTEARGAVPYSEMRRQIEAAERATGGDNLVAAARHLHHWRMEILNGPGERRDAD